jgi:hypothetical protein
MHPGLALIDGNFWFWVSTTNIKTHLHGHRLSFGDEFDFGKLLVHGDYMR